MRADIEGSFKLTEGEDHMPKYPFDTEAAEHYFCSTCGMYTHHNPRSNPNIPRVNAGCIIEIDLMAIEPEVFDGDNI